MALRWLHSSIPLLCLLAACEGRPDVERPPPSEAASAASAALEAAKKAAAEKVTRKVIRRAKNDADLVLTPERRTKLEAQFPAAQGFLELRELEAALFKRDLKRGANDKALVDFDKLAKGRYVLFTGFLMDPKPEGFDLAVRYTPRDPADPVGLTATWFPVHFSRVSGFDQTQYSGGEPVAVLAKYEGNQATSDSHDLVSLELWF